MDFYLDPALIKQQYPSLAQLNKACVKADNNIIDTRDSRDLVSIMERITSISPRLQGLINTRKTGVVSYEYEIRDIKKKALDDVKFRLAKNIKKAIIAPVYKNLFGDFLAEIIVSKGVEGFEIKQIEQSKYEPINEYEFYLYKDDKKEQVSVLDNPNKFIYLVGNVKTRGGSVRSVLDLEIRRYDNIKQWSEFNRRALGQLLGKINDTQLGTIARSLGENPDVSKDIESLNKIIENVGSNNYGILKEAYTVEVAKLIDAAAATTFVNLNKDLDAAISIAILGQANTTELPSSGGSRAALQVLNQIKADIILTDMQEAKEVVDYILKIDYNLTKNSQGVPDYSFEFVYDDNIDVETQSRVIANLSAAMPLQLYSTELYNKIGFTKPDNIEELLTIGNAISI